MVENILFLIFKRDRTLYPIVIC